MNSEVGDRLKKYTYRLGNVPYGNEGRSYFFTQVDRSGVLPEDDEFFRKRQTGNKLAPIKDDRYTFDGWPEGKVVL